MPSARKKCICQLCTCGRHMCSHRNKETHIVLGNEFDLSGQLLQDLRGKDDQWELSDHGPQEISSFVDQRTARQVLADATNRAITIEDKGNGKVSWSARQIPKTLPIRHPDQIKLDGETDYTTLHQADFTRKTLEHISPISEEKDCSSVQQESWNHMQVPKTQPIRNPDSLTLSGPRAMETTNKTDFTESVFENRPAGDAGHRPRTSLKMSGQFEKDSSYQRAFTRKHVDEVANVRKEVVKGHLKPEGEMRFDTTSLDYTAAVQQKERWERHNVALKPRPARPESGIKMSDEPLEDETTVHNDYKRWNVEKPERYRPPDTLDLGFASPEGDLSNMWSRKETTEMSDDAKGKASKQSSKRPKTHLKQVGEIEFTTTSDDYSVRRSRQSPIELETVVEQVETTPREIQVTSKDIDKPAQTESYKQEERADEEARVAISAQELSHPDEGPAKMTEKDNDLAETTPIDKGETEPQNDVEYVSWDQIRPKPIRPHSNLRQEGGMEFNTTNRSEFVERQVERVKGTRPKTTTKVFEGEFDATTMNQIMFAHDHAEKVNPIRPKSNLHVEGGDFEDETTTAREYQQWQIKRPSPILHKSNLTQEGMIDFTTTNRTQFEEKRAEKVYPFRPSTTNKISGDLDLTTTNQMMHGTFPIERVQKIVPKPNLRMNSGAFNDETTNKAQFQEYHVDRRKPIRPVPNLKQEGTMDFMTMNQMQFEERPLEKVQQFRPHTSSKITGDFDGMTINRLMFEEKPIERPQPIRPKDNLELEKGDFVSDTTNKAEFKPWQLTKSQQVTPRNNLQQEGSMDFTTNNQVEFRARVAERVSRVRPTGEKPKPVRPKTNLRPEAGTFEAETTNTREFQKWGYEKPSPIKPHSSLRQEGSMDFTTMNQTQFEGKSVEKAIPFRPITATKVSGDFEGTTTNQAMYHTNPIERVKGIRPSTNIHIEEGRFEDQTTSRREFQKWELSKVDTIQHASTLAQKGSMDFTTSNQVDFSEKHATKEDSTRPHTTSPVRGDFDGTTTNQVAYPKQPIERVHGLKPKDNLRASSGEMQKETTSTDEYGYKDGRKAETVRPKGNINQEGSFDFVTSNQVDFEKKTVDRVALNRPKTLTKSSDGKFYATTTSQSTYQTPAMETAQTVRPKTNIRVEEGGFQRQTTSTDAYQQWKQDKPKAFQLTSSLKQEGNMNFETTNNTEFREKSLERIQQIRPKTTSKIEGDFTATTTNQAMYHQPDTVDRVKPIRHENNLHLEGGKFIDETTTSREYRQWVAQGNQIAVSKKLVTAGVKSQRERVNRRKEILSEDTATQDEQAVTKDESVAPAQASQEDLTKAKEKTSTIKETVVDSEDRQAIKNFKENTSSGKDKQDGQVSWTMPDGTKVAKSATTKVNSPEAKSPESGIKRDVQGRSREDRTKDVVPIKRRYKPEDNLKIDHVPFEGTSTTHTEYKRWQGRRSSSKRRGENLRQEGRMEFDTTSNDYSVMRNYQMRREANKTKAKSDLKGTLGPSGDMQFSTTQTSAYAGATKTRRHNLRPKSSLRLGVSDSATNGDVSTRSNPELSTHQTSITRSSYVGFTGGGIQRPRLHRPPTSQKVGSGAFEGQSTTRTSFGTPQEPPNKHRAIRPESHHILQAKNGFSGNTTYRTSFEKLNGHCPVLDLDSRKGEEKNGHMFYAPRVELAKVLA